MTESKADLIVEKKIITNVSLLDKQQQQQQKQ